MNKYILFILINDSLTINLFKYVRLVPLFGNIRLM